MSENQMEAKIKELRQLQSLIEEAQAEAEGIRDEIKAELAARDLDELRAGEYKVSYKAVKSVRLDTAALKKAAPQLYDLYARETTVRRFCLG